MNIVERVTRLHRSLTEEQAEDLKAILEECKALGVDSKHTAPLFAACYVNPDPSPEQLERARKVAEELIKEDKLKRGKE